MKSLFSLIIIAITLFSLKGFNQEFSNKGREFWVGYGSHVSMYDNSGALSPSGGAQDMVLYFTSDRDANVKIEIPGTGWKDSLKVIANKVSTSNAIPKIGTQDARIGTEGKSKNGIHITSDVPIIAYAHIYNSSISGATLLFPVTTLAREYYSINFEQISNSPYSYCYTYVIATEDSTNIEIIPAANTLLNKIGDTIRIKLNKGEVYNIFGKLNQRVGNNSPYTGEDLTGTKVRSIATATSTCKRIAVFSGSGKLAITCGAGSATSDNYMQQAFPANAWGKKYLTVPTDKLPNNYFRIAVSNPRTVVKVNGQVQTLLLKNFYYQIQTLAPSIIESDEPIMVAQYISSATKAINNNGVSTTQSFCNPDVIGTDGDPEMIYLSPVEQTIQKVTINSTPNARITLHFLNLVIHKNGVQSLKIDGNSPNITSNSHPFDNNYVYYQMPLQAGSHTIESDSGFNAIAYGYGGAESYGYNAGTNVRNLNQYVSISNKYAVVQFPSTCRESPFNLSITLPYKPLKLAWNFYNNKDLGSNPDPLVASNGNPIEPDTTIVNPINIDKQLYVYKLRNNDRSLREFKMTEKGIFPVDVIVNNPTADGCSGEQTIPYDITVYDPPTDSVFPVTSGCFEDSILLNAKTKTDNIPVARYLWNIDNVVYDTTKSIFKFKFNSDGLKNIKLSIITTIGCLSPRYDTTVLLSWKPQPNFEAAGSVCLGKSVDLLNKASLKGNSTIDSLIWSYSDKQISDTLTGASVKQNLNKTFNDSMLIVRVDATTNTGCKNSLVDTLYVKPNPDVKMFLPEICLKEAKAIFKSLSTIPKDNSLTDFLWNFGDQRSDSIGNIGTGDSVVHVYSATGEYKVSLSVTSNFGCNSKRDTSFFVNGSFPRADFDIVNQSQLCSNKPIAIINKSSVDIGSIGRLKVFWNNEAGRINADTTDELPKSNSTYIKSFDNFQKNASIEVPIKLVVYSGGVCADSIQKIAVLNGSPLDKLNTIEPICTRKDKRLLNYATITKVENTDGTEVYTGTGVIKSGEQYFFDPRLDSGFYTIKHRYTTVKGCYAEDSTKIRVNYTPIVDAGPDMTVLEDTSKQIMAMAKGVDMKYKWSPNDSLSSDSILRPFVVKPTKDLIYTLTVTGPGNCSDKDAFKLIALNKVIPSRVFTPNGDRFNDNWVIKYLEKYPGYSIDIFNPQGILVKKINAGDPPWDGTVNGKPSPAGTYYYMIDPKNGRNRITGFVTLLR